MIDKTGEHSFFHCTGINAVFSCNDIDYSSLDGCDMVFANAVGSQCITEKGATTGIKTFGETEDFIKNNL